MVNFLTILLFYTWISNPVAWPSVSLGESGNLINFVFLNYFKLSSELLETTKAEGGGDGEDRVGCLSDQAFSSCFSRSANQFSRLLFSTFSYTLSMTYALFAFL